MNQQLYKVFPIKTFVFRFSFPISSNNQKLEIIDCRTKVDDGGLNDPLNWLRSLAFNCKSDEDLAILYPYIYSIVSENKVFKEILEKLAYKENVDLLWKCILQCSLI